MATDPMIDPALATTEVPPPPETTQPSLDATEDVEALKAKLAATEAEANTWKGRVEKANEKKPKDSRSEEIQELEWKLDNKERISLVKDEYEKILVEGYQGEKVSKKIALELAEKQAKVDVSAPKRDRQDDMSTPSVTNRNANPQGYEDDLDRELNLTQEKKRKMEERHPHLKG